MTSLFTSTLTVPLQRNTSLFLFPLLLLSLLLWHWMRPNLLFLSAASNANRKPGGPLKWKNRLVKDVRLLLPLTAVMKIARFTSQLPDVLRLSSPRPRLRPCRRHAHLSLTFSLVQSLALLPSFLSSPTVLLPGSRVRSSPITWHPTFLSPNQRPCVAETTFPSSAEPRALRSLIRLFAPPSPQANFSLLPQSLLFPCYWPKQGRLSHTSLWHEFSSSHFRSFLVFAFLSFY